MLFLTLLFAAAAPAADVMPRETQIPFVNHRGIRNFEPDGDEAVYLQDQRRDWYRAELAGPCLGLRSALGIGIDTRGSGVLDKFGAILAGGERCPVVSLVRSGKPEKKKRKKAA